MDLLSAEPLKPSMMLTILNDSETIFNYYLAELRNEVIQQDSMRFRRNMERAGEVIAYEISKTLEYRDTEVVTGLGIANEKLPADQPVILSILRAGEPVHRGMLNVFDRAESGFLSTLRHYEQGGGLHISTQYMSCPDIQNKVVILCDAMLATGSTMALAYRSLIERGNPKKVHLVSIIASKEGVNYLRKRIPSQVDLWLGAVDDELTVKSYIVPGLGDAGDLAFGSKPERV